MASTVTPEGLFKLATGFWASKTFLSAVELGVFTELAKGDADLESLRGRLGLHERSARDFLDALVALGMLDRKDGIYRNTPETEMFLDRAKPSYIGGLFEMLNARLFGFWGLLTEALRTGQPQNEFEGILGGSLRQALCRSGAAAHIPVGDERRERRGGTSDRREISLERLSELPGCRGRAGDGARHACARPSASQRCWLRSAAGEADLRGVRGEARPLGSGRSSMQAISSATGWRKRM